MPLRTAAGLALHEGLGATGDARLMAQTAAGGRGWVVAAVGRGRPGPARVRRVRVAGRRRRGADGPKTRVGGEAKP